MADDKKYNRKYKDSLFRMVFREKENLLSLYNAVNSTDYAEVGELKIVTLENAIYMTMKNDVAFLLYDYINMYEHQSTINPNMPLRDLFYIAYEYEKLVDGKQIYGSKTIQIPTPRFIMFYNEALAWFSALRTQNLFSSWSFFWLLASSNLSITFRLMFGSLLLPMI